MREFTKSVISFSWAMSLFGVKQYANLLTPQSPSQPTHKATAAFNSVTYAIEEQLGDTIEKTFKVGDQLQRGTVDLMSRFLTLEGFNPKNWLKMTSWAVKQTGGPESGTQATYSQDIQYQERSGLNPVPPPGNG